MKNVRTHTPGGRVMSQNTKPDAQTVRPQHSPLPWLAGGDGHELERTDGTPWRMLSIWSGNMKTGAGLFNVAGVNVPKGGKWQNPEARANLALIVRAVNSHDALINLVSRALDRFTDNDMMPPNAELCVWLDAAKDILAQEAKP